MYRLIVLIILLFVGIYAYAQNDYYSFYPFPKLIPNQKACSTYDNGFIQVAGDTSVYLTKFDSTGTPLWSKHYSIPNHIICPMDVFELSNHDFFITGNLRGINTYSTYFILLTDPNGSLKFSKMDTDTLPVNPFNQITIAGQDLDGSVVISAAVTIDSLIQNGSYGLVGSIDTLGNVNWFRLLKSDLQYTTLEINSTLLSSGNIVVASHEDDINFGQSYFSIQKLSSTGDSIWSKRSALSQSRCLPYKPVHNGNAYYILSQGNPSSSGHPAAEIIQVDTMNGNLNWHSKYNDLFFTGGGMNMCMLMKDNNIYFQALTSPSMEPIMVKIDSAGGPTSARVFNLIAGTENFLPYLVRSFKLYSGVPMLYGFGGTSNDSTGFLYAKLDSILQSKCHSTVVPVNPPVYYNNGFVNTGTSDSISLTLMDISNFIMVDTFNLTTMDICSLIDGSGDNQQVYFSIYPNPAVGEISITFPQTKYAYIELFNQLGKKLYETTSPSG